MARTRNIKPGFFKNDLLAECSALARILFAGLWTIADRDGRGEYRPKVIKAEVLPYDECDVNALMAELVEREFVIVYEVDGRLLFELPTFGNHQNPHRDEKSREFPASTVQVQCKYESSPEKTGSGRAFFLPPSTLNLNPSTSLMGETLSASSPTVADKDAPKEVPCPQDPSEPESPIVFTFPCDGTPKHFYVRQSLVNELGDLFPKLIPADEVRSALAWVMGNSVNRKTARGMRSFLTGWFQRSNDRLRGPPNGADRARRRIDPASFPTDPT